VIKRNGPSVTVIDANKTQYKIRLAGIDAPEKAQAYGQKSKESLSDLVFGKQVDVEWSKRDRYGRTVGKLMLGGVDINLEQIKNGMA
jgi:endonuclease YncB( thermonuclease family)